MGVLGVLFGGSYLAMGTGQKKEDGPPIKASSQDEEKFIQCVIPSMLKENLTQTLPLCVQMAMMVVMWV